MTAREVAAALREISQLLQLKGENAFKVRAYDLAADAFETLPPDPAAPGAVSAIAAHPDADVGDLGILFFQHIIASDPQAKIHVKLHSGLIKLTLRGWLSVMATGGGKVIAWLAKQGLKGPSAIASAVARLRKG